MVDKTMMGDKCAELVRAAMIGALAVTLGNPTAVYAAEEETADPGQIGIEIAGEAAVGAASFCVEEDAAEEAPAEAEEVTESEGTQNDEMEEESGSEGKEDETVPEEPEPQEPDGGENAGMTEPGKTGETEPEGPENAEPGEAGETEPEEPENPEPGDQGDMPETPGNSEMDGPWPGEGEDISNDPWPGQEEIGGGDGEQMEPPEEENGSAGSDDAAGGDKTAEVSSDSDLSQSAEPPAAEAEPVFSAEQEFFRVLQDLAARFVRRKKCSRRCICIGVRLIIPWLHPHFRHGKTFLLPTVYLFFSLFSAQEIPRADKSTDIAGFHINPVRIRIR